MATPQTPPQPSVPLFGNPWPGYWTTKKCLARLGRFKNLIIHRERWAAEMQSVMPLTELFPGENVQEMTFEAVQRIELEIREMLALVHLDLRRAGVHTRSRFRNVDSVENPNATTEYDLTLDYFIASRSPIRKRQNFETLMERLDMAIGLYKARLPRAKRELFSLVAWMAYIARLPITVLERAGLASRPETQQMILSGYGKVAKTLMVVILVLIAIHLGVSIPWRNVGEWVVALLK